MRNAKMVETVADIAYIAGCRKFYSGDSRQDISRYIQWAVEFEEIHIATDWNEADYMLLVEEYANSKIRDEMDC